MFACRVALNAFNYLYYTRQLKMFKIKHMALTSKLALE